MPDNEVEKIKQELRDKHDIELRKLKDKQRAEKAEANKKIRQLRNASIFRLGSAFEKLDLLEVEYYAVLGCLAQNKSDLLNSDSILYKEWIITGEQVYKSGKKD